MANDNTPETPGSSAQTAIAVGAGTVLGAALLTAAAPVVLPVVGLGALAAAVTPIVGGTIGGLLGWKWGGKQ
jgi:hypothetical protein